jgi:rhamnosyl/mannosyltransferase
LVHYKGFKYLVDAARYLDDDDVILIGGTGALREELQLQITENHLENRVLLLGRVSDEDLPSYYGACDLFCLSSVQKTEAFAIVQIESMSCGKPVVSCNIEGSGVPWVNADGVSGLVVETENGKTLAEAIRRIIESPNLYASLSEGAKQRFSQLFVKEKMIGGCYAIYQQALGM